MQKSGELLRDVIGWRRTLGIFPFLEGSRDTAVLLACELREFLPQSVQRGAFQTRDPPPEQTVFVLELNNGYCRVIAESHVCVWIFSSEQRLHPGLEEFLRLGVEV